MDNFITRGAQIMAEDRPDLWDVYSAQTTLKSWAFDLLTKYEGTTASIASGGFQLTKHVDEEGMVEWNLDRNILSGYLDNEIFDWTNSSSKF